MNPYVKQDDLSKRVSTGLPPLDEIIQGLRLGDNVVWQVDDLEGYEYFARPFVEQGIKDGRRCVYVRFAPHAPIFEPRPGLEVLEVDPGPGFDSFSGEVHRIVEERGREAFYVFDNLSALVVEWATDESLANFFQFICPYLFELDTVAYFALTCNQHSHAAITRVRDTTQVLINVYSVNGNKYIHPLKVWGRYSSQMFLPHLILDGAWSPVFDSGAAAEVITVARTKPLGATISTHAPWESVYRKLVQYQEAGEILAETTPEIAALKKEFSRMMLGDVPELNRLVDRYLTLDDLFGIRDRLIGSGRIGGKAAGMLLARRILLQHKGTIDFSEVLEGHDSFYIGSDLFYTFLIHNDLFRLRLQLSSVSECSWEEFEQVQQRFLAGEFPQDVVEQFRSMLDYFGQAPIIVRSSSLLEDSFGSAFAGKYRSEFCANQGHPDERLEAFMRAVKLVYASTLNPAVLSYRRRRGLGESDEQMAILVQRVSGRPYKNFFFPPLAGVALSRNLYVWTDRIDPRQGIIRLVFGLGTRAVERVGVDYPRMIPVGNPALRPEVGMQVVKYSQRLLDLIDLGANQFATYRLSEVIETDYPNLYLYASEVREGGLYDPIARYIQSPAQDLVLTFNNLVNRTRFVAVIREMLATLEEVYGHPVEVEFTASPTADGRVRVNLLQCRPMWISGAGGRVRLPTDVPQERILFRSSRFIGGGMVEKIRYIIYIDPEQYAALDRMEAKKSVGRIVGRVNALVRETGSRELVMGPGRFGSSNINLGVNVSYADIDNAGVLVEVAREEAGQVPEVSYGTHFFQDLVEGQIIYIPVYPDDRSAEFNRDFFERAPNSLKAFIPDTEGLDDVVRVIDVCAATDGRYANVVADPHSRRALCFLA